MKILAWVPNSFINAASSKSFRKVKEWWTRVDPASKVWGRYQQLSVVMSHNGFATVREMKYTSQHCCDKTTDDKIPLHRANLVFRIVQNYGEYTGFHRL